MFSENPNFFLAILPNPLYLILKNRHSPLANPGIKTAASLAVYSVKACLLVLLTALLSPEKPLLCLYCEFYCRIASNY